MHGFREPSVDFDYDAVESVENPILSGIEITVETLAKLPQVQALIRQKCTEALLTTIQLIRYDPRPRLAADCLLMAIGGDLRPDGTTMSMTEVGKNYGMTKAAISKRVYSMRDRFSLPPNRYFKSDASRRVYALTNASPIRLRDDSPVRGCRPPKRA